MFSTVYPYECNANVYENDNVKITASGDYDGNDIKQFLMNTSKPVWGNYGSTYFQFDFKTPITLKRVDLYARSSGYWCITHVYYLIDGTWIEQAETQKAREYEATITNLPEMKISSVKIAIDEAGKIGTTRPSNYFHNLVLYFDITSAMVKSKVQNVIVQNELWSKYTSGVDIDDGTAEVSIVSDESDSNAIVTMNVIQPTLTEEEARELGLLDEEGE